MLRRVFCFLRIAVSVSSSGLSMPTIIALFNPILQHGQKSLDSFFVADQIVVDEIDVAAITKVVERIELREHLRMRLGSRRPAIQFDDVAELAGERAAARELHADVKVLIELEQVEARYRRLGHVDLEFRRLESALALAFLPRGDEFVDNALGLADDAEIRRSIAMGTGTHIGPADHHG